MTLSRPFGVDQFKHEFNMLSFIIAVVLILFVAWYIENQRRNAHPVDGGLQVDIELPHQQQFELYHNAVSLCSMKVRVCMAELQLPYKSHHVNLIETGAFETTRARFRRINPGGTVPVLVHNGHPVYESHEQIRYAAQHCPSHSSSLLPKSEEEQLQMEDWIDRSSLTADPIHQMAASSGNAAAGQTIALLAAVVKKIPTWRIFEGLLFHHDRRRLVLFLMLKFKGMAVFGRNPSLDEMLVQSRTHMHGHLDVLETQLTASGGPWLLGGQFTLADVSWLVIFERLRQLDALEVFVAADQRPACCSYWRRLQERPSYQTAILDQSHSIVAFGTEVLRGSKAADPVLRRLLEGT